MSDLGNRGWSNSVNVGEDIDLGELLLDRASFTFVPSSFHFFRGGPILGFQNTKNHPYECQLSSSITINGENTQHKNWYRMFALRTYFYMVYDFGEYNNWEEIAMALIYSNFDPPENTKNSPTSKIHKFYL